MSGPSKRVMRALGADHMRESPLRGGLVNCVSLSRPALRDPKHGFPHLRPKAGSARQSPIRERLSEKCSKTTAPEFKTTNPRHRLRRRALGDSCNIRATPPTRLQATQSPISTSCAQGLWSPHATPARSSLVCISGFCSRGQATKHGDKGQEKTGPAMRRSWFAYPSPRNAPPTLSTYCKRLHRGGARAVNTQG